MGKQGESSGKGAWRDESIPCQHCNFSLLELVDLKCIVGRCDEKDQANPSGAHDELAGWRSQNLFSWRKSSCAHAASNKRESSHSAAVAT